MVEHQRQWVQELVVCGRSSGSYVVCYLGSKVYLWSNRGRFINQCCVRPVLLYCCETWELTVADESRLGRVERCMIRMMCGWVRLVDRMSTDVLCDRGEGGCCEDWGYDNLKPPVVVLHSIKRNGESGLEGKLLTLASWDNDIKMDAVVLLLLQSVFFFIELVIYQQCTNYCLPV